MAVHNVDQKVLGRLSYETAARDARLSSALYQILGLSVMLTKRLYRARKLRKLDTSRDTKSLALYHHIIWMSREGLSVTETIIIPSVSAGQHGTILRVFAAKLRASFYHIFALFHNQPPVNYLNATPYGSQLALSPSGQKTANGHAKRSPPSRTGKVEDSKPYSRARDRTAALRDTIPSMTSEASYITNPYSREAPISPPPGLPQPSAFILPSTNFVPMASTSFKNALEEANDLLPGSAPLRLSIALEYCAFMWDCLHDHEGSRRLARATIREVYREQSGMDDNEFEDAADLVGTLGRMMRRKSNDATPKIGAPSPNNPGRTGILTPPVSITPTPPPSAPLPSVPPPTVPPKATAEAARRSPASGIPRRVVGTPPGSHAAASPPPRTVARKPVPVSKSPPRAGGDPGRASGANRSAARRSPNEASSSRPQSPRERRERERERRGPGSSGTGSPPQGKSHKRN